METQAGVNSLDRRHSRWYELLLFSGVLQIFVGLCVAVVLPAVVSWQWAFWWDLDPVRTNTLMATVASFVVVELLLRRLGHFSVGSIIEHILPLTTGVFFLAFFLLLFTRGAYSRSVLLASYVLTMGWCFAGHFMGRRYRRLKFALVPIDSTYAPRPSRNLDIRRLSEPNLRGVRYDAVVADLSAREIAPKWRRFLAECALANIPVLHARRVVEGQTGRIAVDYLSEVEVWTLAPPPLYMACKRFIDVGSVVVTAPVTVPLMLLTGLAVRLDSPGPALFVQDRVGLGGRNFRICKFRSMKVGSDATAAETKDDDDRITRVGAFIRKTRLDELPQLWNVLVGDMSLIGPRPEIREFIEYFNEKIPFYNYRHVVRPGITGWAQVVQGATNNMAGARGKIQHDLYYIKNFSLWLDILIVLKTLRIIVTGWGAR